MIGPILLLISWALLRGEGKTLRVLGFNLPALRAREFGLGFLVTGIAAAVQQLGSAWAAGDAWRRNPALTGELVLRQLRATINSVLFEELLFRGYLLYLAMRLLGPRRGVWLSAAAFGLYHWFTFGVLGNPRAMLYVLVLTGAFGAMCALAFARTQSIAAPIGLHLGWNFVSYVIFSAGPLGAGLLLPASGAARMKPGGALGVLFGFGLQLALALGVGVALRRRRGLAAAAGQGGARDPAAT